MALKNRWVIVTTVSLVAVIISFISIFSVFRYGCVYFRPGFSQLCSVLFFPSLSSLFGNSWPMIVRYVFPLLIGGFVAIITLILTRNRVVE